MKQYTQQQIKFLKENFQQGQKAMQMGIFARAEKHFLDVLKIDANIVEARNALAFALAASKQHAKAAAQFEIVLKTHPNDAHTQHNLANCLYELGQFDKAIEHYQRALAINPNLVNTHIHIAITYRAMRNYEAAIKSLHQALNLDKTNARAFHTLGVLYAEIEDYPRALECLKNASRLAPNNAEFGLSYANILEKSELDLEAGFEYHRTCLAAPNHLDAFILYGNFLNKNQQHSEAVECFLRAEQLSPQSLDVFDELGSAYTGMGDTNSAIEKFKSALLKEPNRISSLTGLVQSYQQAGRLDDAINTCNRIIAIDINEPSGYVLKARAKKSQSDDELAENLLRISTNENLNNEDSIHVNYSLGKVFDDQKRYAEAFKYYLNANSLQNKSFQKYDAKEDADKFNKLIEVFNYDFLRKHEQLGVNSNLPIIIVGMPRSATTLTEQILCSHPDVMGAGEVTFWGRARTAIPLRMNSDIPYPDCMHNITTELAKETADLYEATLRKIIGPNAHPRHITDKMPHNFLNVGLIAMLFPNVKIIHTLRDPIDTCLSIFFHNFNETHSYASDLVSLAQHYKQYQRLMQHWHTVLPGRIMDIHYADTISDPEYWTRKLIEHVELEWNDACLAPHKIDRSVRTFSNWQVRQPIYKTSNQRWKNYEEFLQPLIETLNAD